VYSPPIHIIHSNTVQYVGPDIKGGIIIISLQSCAEAEIIHNFKVTSGNGDHLELSVTLTSESDYTSFAVLPDLGNVGLAFGMPLLSCMKAKMFVLLYTYFR
jgi:hypothetical protein